jgi:hypothetical protein
MSYSTEDILPGLPHPEMPFIVLADASPSLIQQVIASISQRGNVEEEGTKECHVSNLHPTDCTTIMGAMRALISGFVNSEKTSLGACVLLVISTIMIFFIEAISPVREL